MKNFILFASLLLVVLGSIIYSNSLDSGFQFDDQYLVEHMSFIRDISNIKSIWGFRKQGFVTYLTFALNYHFAKQRVLDYHIVNLIIHLFSSILVFHLVRLTFKTPKMKNSPMGRDADVLALFAGLVFLCHPLQTQAVTYIMQRLASLSTLFYLGAVVLYIKGRLERRVLYFILALLTAIIAVFTKENTVTLPLTVLLYETAFFGVDSRKMKKILLYFMPFLIISVIVLAYRMTLKYPWQTQGGINQFLQQLDFATRATVDISRKDYLLTQFNVLRTYIRLLFLPVNQNLDHDYYISRSLSEPGTALSLAFLVAIIFFAIKIFRRHRLVSFGIFWFFITISVESSIIPLPDVIFEHRLYLPMVGFGMFITSGLYLLIKDRKRFIALLSIVITVLSLLTYNRNKVWKDDLTLWTDVVRKSPNKARAHHNLGFAYHRIERHNDAIIEYKKAIRLNPVDAKAYMNLGVVYSSLGYYDKAIKCHLNSIKFGPENYDVYCNLMSAYEKEGKLDKAIEHYQKAVKLRPRSDKAYFILGFAYARKGELEKSINYYNKAAQLAPDEAKIYNNVGTSYGQKGDYDKAIECCRRAIQLKPDYAEAYHNLGLAYNKKGSLEEAIKNYRKAVQLKPDFTEAYCSLASLYGNKGDYDKAIEYCLTAIKLEPNHAKAHHNLGVSYIYKNDLTNAQKQIHKLQELGRSDLKNHLKRIINRR